MPAPRMSARYLLPLAVLSLSALSTMSSSPARAAGPSRDECIAAADEGQKLRDDGKLGAAHKMNFSRAAKACPAVVAKACAGWREDADRDMPTATFRVLDEQGKELLDVKVAIDAAVDAQPVSAKALPLDPGEHVVHVKRNDGKTLDEKFLLRPGEKNRMVDVRFPPPLVAAPPPTPKPEPAKPQGPTSDGFRVPLLGWVGLGVFVAGGATTTVFAVMAKSDESDERAKGCAPGCPPSDKDGINTKLAIANVGMGVGIVGLGVAVVTTVLANTGSRSAATGSTPPGQTAKSVQNAGIGALHVDASPGGMWLSGSF
jgi:hypothetical protein